MSRTKTFVDIKARWRFTISAPHDFATSIATLAVEAAINILTEKTCFSTNVNCRSSWVVRVALVDINTASFRRIVRIESEAIFARALKINSEVRATVIFDRAILVVATESAGHRTAIIAAVSFAKIGQRISSFHA